MNEVRIDVEALYAALDAKRRSADLSWRQLAREVGVSPSTLTRMAQGKRPDVDGFAALVQWLGIPAERFMRGTSEAPDREAMAEISSLLRARRDLSPQSAAALEDIIRAAYDRLREPGGQTSRGARDRPQEGRDDKTRRGGRRGSRAPRPVQD